ncbi:MAG: hypothetical protein GTO35_00255, partial [Gammaproteobacteria bacterium]|nr:hypothetical protein [Gammaproteobacteria bacterium]
MKLKRIIAVLLLFALIQLVAISISPSQASTAAIWTDKADYTPGETVTVMGTGFVPNAYYDIPVIRPDGTIVPGDGSTTPGWDTVLADAYGSITYYYLLNGISGLYEVRVYDSPWSGNLDETALATTTFTDAKPAADLDQVRNGPATAPWDPAEWVNGNAGPSNAHYAEGYSIPYRCIMTDLPIGTPITITFGYDIKHGDRHAIDYLTHYNRTDNPSHETVFGHPPEEIDPTDGITGTWTVNDTHTIPRPDTTNSPVDDMPGLSWDWLVGNETIDGVAMTIFNGTISDITYDEDGDLTASQSEARLNVTFTAVGPTAVLAWGGHIASRLDWGYDDAGDPRSAGGLTGSPYHMRLIGWTINNLGQQDRSLKVAAVFVPGTVVIVKDAIPDDPQEFDFTSTTLPDSAFTLVDDGIVDNWIMYSGLAAGTYNVTEIIPTGWDLTSLTVSDPDGESSVVDETAFIDLDAGETIYVYYENTKLGIKAGRKWDDTNGNGVWDTGEPALSGWTINLYNST